MCQVQALCFFLYSRLPAPKEVEEVRAGKRERSRFLLPFCATVGWMCAGRRPKPRCAPPRERTGRHDTPHSIEPVGSQRSLADALTTRDGATARGAQHLISSAAGDGTNYPVDFVHRTMWGKVSWSGPGACGRISTITVSLVQLLRGLLGLEWILGRRE